MNRHNPRLNKALTLLELIMSIAIISLIVLGFTSLNLYIRSNVQQADRRTRVQNTLSYALDHMTKEIGKAIGDKNNSPIDTTTGIGGDTAIIVRIDSNNNGKLDVPPDIQIAYAYHLSSHEIWYYSDYANHPTDHQTIAKNIMRDLSEGCSSPIKFSCIRYDNTNYIDIRLSGRWDAIKDKSQDNPQITMTTRIVMPGVSTQ